MRDSKKKIAVRAERAIRDKVFPGCIIGILDDRSKTLLPFGSYTYERDSETVTHNSVYDLASITKSLPTATLASMFINENKLRLTDLVRKYIPELRNDYDANIEDLLRYRVQGPRLSELRFNTFEEIRTQVYERGFKGPAAVHNYSNAPAYILGNVLEKISGKSIAAIADQYMFGPLNMKRTTFFPSQTDCVPTEIQNGKELRGVVHDESARVFAVARRSVGHAGLFSTAPDVMLFVENLLANKFPGALDAAKSGLGWEDYAPWFLPDGMFGKTGFTGTSITVDPEHKRALVIFSNRTYPTRPADSTAINSLRRDIADIVLG